VILRLALQFPESLDVPRTELEPIAITYSREFVSIRGSKKRYAHNLMVNRMIANLREARDVFR
jgi:hypothetical protein